MRIRHLVSWAAHSHLRPHYTRMMSTQWPTSPPYPEPPHPEPPHPEPPYPEPPPFDSSLSQLQSPEIHILGTGNIGNLVAYSLRTLPYPPPITLLFHNREREADFHAAQYSITLRRRTHRLERYDSVATGFRYSLVFSPPPTTSASYHISNLIVVTKAHQTLAALRPLKERLGRESTVLLLQNGVGVVDELKTRLFTDPETRPHIVLGITTHGVYKETAFTIIQRGLGMLQLGYLPPSPGPSLEPPELSSLPLSTSYLLSMLLQTSLSTMHLAPMAILAAQFEKLAINAIINPLTVLYHCRNGELLNNHHVVRTARILLWEISHVLMAIPELDGMAGKEQRFSADRLYDVIISVARATGGNWSSMVQDVVAGKQTEIDYINGFVVAKAMELSLPCTANHMVLSMVKAKGKMLQLRADEELPFTC